LYDFEDEPPVLSSDKSSPQRKENNPKPNSAFSQPEHAGYMPSRGDFETEWDNDAELILCDMAFADDDTPVERDLKLRILEIYNQKLDDRAYRKKFIQERNLFDYKKSEKKKNPEDRDIRDRMRIFARLMSKEDHEQFVKGIIAERTFRKRIEELKRYRKLGIRTLEEIHQYQVYQKTKEGEHSLTRNKSREVASFFLERRERDRTEVSVNIPVKQEKPVDNSDKLRTPKSLDISEASCYDLLSDKEKELCSEIRLFPQQYMLVKDTLLRESLRTGYLKKQVARTLIKIDVNKTSRVFDFLESSGWINKQIVPNPSALPPIYQPTPVPTDPQKQVSS